jgi:hypothetical protein
VLHSWARSSAPMGLVSPGSLHHQACRAPGWPACSGMIPALRSAAVSIRSLLAGQPFCAQAARPVCEGRGPSLRMNRRSLAPSSAFDIGYQRTALRPNSSANAQVRWGTTDWSSLRT